MKIFQTSVILSLCFAAITLTGCKKKNEKPTVAPPVRVSVMVVQNRDYNESIEYSGTVASANDATVSFSVAGTILDLYATEGQKVSKGQLLGKLKDGDYVNASNIAEAELAEAQDGFERLKKLHDANALPDIKWVEIQQKLKQAQNAADIAQRALKETRLYAPMSGVISKRLADKGQNVAPIEPIYEIVSTDDLTVDVSVPENEIGLFRIGQPAIVSFQNSEPISGVISQKSIVADPLTRSFTVKVAISSDSGDILPGMVGSVTFVSTEEDSSGTHGITLPSQAVNLTNENKTFVWVIKNNKAVQRFVTADELVAAGVMVKSGLQPDDSVIVAGMQKVSAGSDVVVVEP